MGEDKMMGNVTCSKKFKLRVNRENKIEQIYEGRYQTKSEGLEISNYIKQIKYKYWDKYGKSEELMIIFSNDIVAFIETISDRIHVHSNKDRGNIGSASEFKSKAWNKTDPTVRETFLESLSPEAKSLLEKVLEE